MQLRFYIDEDAQRNAFVQALRQANIDVVTVSEAARVGYSDAEQLAWAMAQGRVIYTFNVRDFDQLHREYLATGQHHAGIVAIPSQGYSVGQQLRGVQNLMAAMTADTMIDQMIFLSRYL
jgi:Domain of unknown function (DUF5615)